MVVTDATSGSAKGSKKRKIEEISHADANASSPSQSRKKLLKQSPSKEEFASSEVKEEFVSLASVYLKPASSQDASAEEAALNMDSLKQALPKVVTTATCDD